MRQGNSGKKGVSNMYLSGSGHSGWRVQSPVHRNGNLRVLDEPRTVL